MCPTHLGLVHEAGQESVKGGVINVTKVEIFFSWNSLHMVLFLINWFLGPT